MANIVIIDDEAAVCSSLKFALAPFYQVKCFTTSDKAIQYIEDNLVHVVLLDKNLGEEDGLEVLEKIKEKKKHIPVIMMTAYGTIQSSVEAIKKGAFQYITKPIDLEELEAIICRGVNMTNLQKKVALLDETIKKGYNYSGLVGKSKEAKKLVELIERVKNIDSNILIIGESGTGKEMVARAIHFGGKRKNEKFVAVNCSAIPNSLLESELFGYEKGAFTGANIAKKGYFELANKGTIFLDEIGDMDMFLQSKILRVIQEKKVYPIGSETGRNIDVRILSATNVDLKAAIEEKKFRLDLYYRLNVINISIPSLRQRKGDIPILVDHFIEKHNTIQNKSIAGITKQALSYLINYDYEGNIRELENIIERAIALNKEEWLDLEDVKLDGPIKSQSSQIIEENKVCFEVGMSLKEIEKIAIMETMKFAGGKQIKAAEILGISDRTLRNKLKEYN